MLFIKAAMILSIATWNDIHPPYQKHSFEEMVPLEICELAQRSWEILAETHNNAGNYKISCVDPVTRKPFPPA